MPGRSRWGDRVETAIVTALCLIVVLSVTGPAAAATSSTDTVSSVDGEAAANERFGTDTTGTRGSTPEMERRPLARSAHGGANDTAVVWRGFRHAWSYNHRFNRIGSWVEMRNCDGSSCTYDVAHSGASGTGEDTAAVRDAYTELSARNVSFYADSETIQLRGQKEDDPYDDSATVRLDLSQHPELQGHDEYAAVLNGFDLVSTGESAKPKQLTLEVKQPTVSNGELTFDLEYTVQLGCSSVECDRIGFGNQDIEYDLTLQYLVVGGNDSALNTEVGTAMSADPRWARCKNNGPASNDPWPDPANSFPGDHMYCEGTGGEEIHHENYRRTGTISGDAAGSVSSYETGAVGVQRLHLDVDDEAHMVQYDSVVGGGYDREDGSYDVRALPFFKEWSTRPGMYMDAKFALGHEGGATVSVTPLLLQLRNACKRSFVSGGELHWEGGGKSATNSDAVLDETHSFSFGDTPEGYGYSRGDACAGIADGSGDWQDEQEVVGRTTTFLDVFPIRDGAPDQVGDPGDHVDIWDEFDEADAGNDVPMAEKSVEDPTQLRGRPSDRFIGSTTDSRNYANLSKLSVTVASEDATGATLDSEDLDLDNGGSSYYDADPDVHVNAGEDVVTESPGVLLHPGTDMVYVSVQNPVDKYDVEAYVTEPGEPDDRWLDEASGVSTPTLYERLDSAGDYTLELLVYCPDESCQPVHVTVPIRATHEPSLRELTDYHNTTEVSDGHPRADRDYYNVTLERDERFSHVRLTGGEGLELTLRQGGSELRTVGNGEVINTTTTDYEGPYQFVVEGDAIVDEYRLNVTTQRISQKFEENDRKSAAADLSADDPTFQAIRHQEVQQNCEGDGGSDDSVWDDSDIGAGTQFCSPLVWWTTVEEPAGYSPSDADWYFLELYEGESIHVNLTDERLGIELHHDGTKVVDTERSSIKYVPESNGTYYINVTGDDYVSAHLIRYDLTIASAVDRLEPNDRQETATDVSADYGNDTQTYETLTIGNVDADYFAVELNDGDELNATLSYEKPSGPGSGNSNLIELTVVAPDGTVIEPRRFSLPSESNQLKRVETTTRQSGTYYVVVDGEGGGLEYDLTIETEKSRDASAPGFGLALAAIALLLAAFVARRRT